MTLKNEEVNPIFDTMYLVYVDGNFEGITDDEYLICDIVADATNGVTNPVLDDDYPNRVFYDTININRYVSCGTYNIKDKVLNSYLMCYNKEEKEKAIKQLNALNFEKERAKAKLRAIAL